MRRSSKPVVLTAICAALFLLAAFTITSMFSSGSNDDESALSNLASSQIIDDDQSEQNEESILDETSDIEEYVPTEEEQFQEYVNIIITNKNNLNVSITENVDEEFVNRFDMLLGREKVKLLSECLAEGKIDSAVFYEKFGYSEKAFSSILNDDLYRTTIIKDGKNNNIVFVGDVSFDDRYSVMNHYNSRGQGIEGIVSSDVLKLMRNADITMANNEFTFTNRGTPTPDKKYTFRSNPKNVSIYGEMGVDIVGMANNHAFDYGPDSLTDTLATLDGASIAHVGAGENLNDAKAPYFYIINGYKVAIIAGSAIDRFSTQGATDTQSGVFQIYDTTSMCKAISSAKAVADIVIAYVHWGNESTTELTGGQKSMGKAFIDAGADLIVGMHSHCMQGIEHYKGKLIVYSLGNFTFSGYTLTGALLDTTITSEGELLNKFYPLMHKNNFTNLNVGKEGAEQLALLKSLMINTMIDDEYVVYSKEGE